MKKFLFSAFILAPFLALAQPDSETFPDFTETDINGVEHNLNSYLEDGKIVIIDVFATWCTTCTASLPGLEALEDQFEDELIFLSFEKYANTNTEASWAETNGVTNPVFANSLDAIATWNTQAQPNFFVVCPDGSFELKVGGIGSNPSTLAAYVETCLEGLADSVDELATLNLEILTNPVNTELSIKTSEVQTNYEIFGLTGQKLLSGSLEDVISTIDVTFLEKGLYFMRLEYNGNEVTKKFIKE